MSSISRIKAQAFKGRSFEYELSPVTIIHGDNFTGKTAVADALRIALLGYSPRHGDQQNKTWGFAGLPNGTTEMSIQSWFSTNEHFTHSWQMKKGKVTHDIQGDMIGAGGKLQLSLIPPVLLNAREFLGLSGPAKVRFIFNQIDLVALGFSTEKVTARIKADVKVESPDEISERILGDVVDDIENLAAERDEFKWTYQEWIEKIVQRIKGLKTDADAVVQDMAGTIQGMTQLRAQEGLASGTNVEKELQAARVALQQAVAAHQNLVRQRKEFTDTSARRKMLEKEIAGQSDQTEAIAKAEATHNEQIKELEKYKSKLPDLLAEREPLEKDHSILKDRCASLKNEILDQTAKLEADLKLDACPHCRSKGKGWKANLKKSVTAVISDMNRAVSDYESKAKEIAGKIVRLDRIIAEAKAIDAKMDELRLKSFEVGKWIAGAMKANQQLVADKARLSEMRTDLTDVSDEAFERAGAKEREARAAVDLLENKERQRIAATQDLKRAEEARQHHAEKKQESEVYRLSLKALAALQTDLMESAFGGFMDKVNEFCAGILPGKLVYRDGEIGYFAGASFAGLDYFSGTEELLAFAGLSVALAGQSPIKIVILDEMGRLKPQRKIEVLERMRSLITREIIDQCIAIDVSADWVPPGWKAVRIIEIV